jgi:glutamate decarboxylase
VALSYKDDVRDSLEDSVFTRGALSKPLPKYKFPEKESLAADVFQIVQDELLLDGNARQNLATFCQTWEEPEVHKIMDLAIDKNMVDKDEYPQTAELRRAASTCSPTFGTAPTPPIPSARRRSARAKPACSAAWR